MPLLLKIILDIFGYLVVGYFSTFLLPLYENLWYIVTLKFKKFEYDYAMIIDFFSHENDEILFSALYFIFWPVGHAIFLAITPIVLFFNTMKFLFLLPINIKEKNEKELKDREKYIQEVEYKYQNIIVKERKNDTKN